MIQVGSRVLLQVICMRQNFPAFYEGLPGGKLCARFVFNYYSSFHRCPSGEGCPSSFTPFSRARELCFQMEMSLRRKRGLSLDSKKEEASLISISLCPSPIAPSTVPLSPSRRRRRGGQTRGE